VQAGCVPFNVFGKGSPSAAALAYITGTAWTKTVLKQQEANFNIKGSPFATWAGPVNLAAGGEYRTESINAVSDPISEIVGWSTANGGFFSGKEDVGELYAEGEAPLAREVRFIKALDVNGAVRWTDYSLSGQATTWKFGATYEPFADLRFRATHSRDLRAPNLNELYANSGSGIALASAINPFNGQSGALNSSSGGNRNLVPETALTTTYGVAYKPLWLLGFTASIDAYDINIRNVITSLTALQILQFCQQGQTQYCSAITFNNSTFGVANVATEPFNLNDESTTGFDLEFDYHVPLSAISIPGNLNLRALGTHVITLKTTSLGVTVDRAGSLQGGGLPSWVWTFNANYTLHAFSTTLTARYVSASLYDATLVGPGQPGYSPTLPNSIANNTFPSATYFDLGASYDIVAHGNKLFTVYGVINNVLNSAPPPYAAVGISTGGDPYDLIGRVFKFGVRFKY
jgi:outer membrane receptor protein involved in Fe transport